MEAITLGGLAIVLYGLWIEFEAPLKTMLTTLRNSARTLTTLLHIPTKAPHWGGSALPGWNCSYQRK